MSETPTPIEQKQSDNSTDSGASSENNWGSFGIAVVRNFIVTLVIGIIGANFIFFSTLSAKELARFFPGPGSGAYSPVPSPAQSGGEFTCPSKGKSTRMPGMNLNALRSLGIGTMGGWPYNLYDGNVDENVSFGSFKNWFSETVAGAYGPNRSYLAKWISLFSPQDGKNMLSNNVFQMLVVAPLTLLAGGQGIVFIVGFLSTLFSAFTANSWGWQWALIGLFLAYTWLTSLGVAFVQYLQFMATFLFLPAFSNMSALKRILSCNSSMLGWLFGAFVVTAAASTLDSTVSMTMLVVYLILALKAIIF
jgi:hypothetical protein|tara:strand:- start:789 stop:1706 length:918 start_codon:yes stop_codon:yes gene_type:complete